MALGQYIHIGLISLVMSDPSVYTFSSFPSINVNRDETSLCPTFLVRDVIYTSRAYAIMPVFVYLSLT